MLDFAIVALPGVDHVLYKLAEGKTERWKRVWVWEHGIAEAVLFKFGKWVTYVAAVCILCILFMNWFVVGQRLTPWAGAMSGIPYEVTGFLMGIASIVAIAFTWYQGAHIRITFFRERAGPRARAALDALGALCFMGWTGAMAWGTWWAAQDAIVRGKCSMVACIPEAPFRFVFWFAALHFMVVLLRSFIGATLRALKTHGPEDDSNDWKAGRIMW